MLEINIEAFRQLSSLGSVLAGFSITIISFLLSSKGNSEKTKSSIILYFISSALFLFVTVVLSFAVIIANKAQLIEIDISSSLRAIGSISMYVFFVGMIMFCLATGKIGKLYSETMAHFSFWLMVITMAAVIGFVVYISLLL